jgi:hypothetical protein
MSPARNKGFREELSKVFRGGRSKGFRKLFKVELPTSYHAWVKEFGT